MLKGCGNTANKQSLLFFVLCLLTHQYSLANTLSVALVSPSPRVEGFWQLYEDVMAAAASDLDIQLTVIHAQSTDRFEHLKAVERLVSKTSKPDYLVTLFRENTSDRMLSILQQAKVKYFSTNADIPENQRHIIGMPRSQYSNWIGHMYPDDQQAGRLLTEKLVAYQKNIGSASPINLIAISGSRDSSAVYHRNAGLNAVVKNTQNLNLLQLIFTDWQYNTVYQLAPQLLKRYPQANVIWSANDEIAKAFLDAVRDNKIDGEYAVGSIDWSYRGIAGVRDEHLVTSIGGHFLEGAIILALLKNFHTGHDFADSFGLSIKMQMAALDEENLEPVSELVMQNAWQRLDFAMLSERLKYVRNDRQYGYWQIISDIIRSTEKTSQPSK